MSTRPNFHSDHTPMRVVLLAATLGFCSLARAAAGDTPPAVGNDQDGSEAVQEVTVTATRYAESIAKVPVSVTALTGEDLQAQGVKNMDDITRLVPGVSFNYSIANSSSISIRGISSSSGAATTGVYINETPIQSRTMGQGGTTTDSYPTVFDLDRIEVLRGPQGTLFGAGSQGGTIRFITPQPDLRNSSVYAHSEFASVAGGEPSYNAGIAVGTPIIDDVLGIRVSGYFQRDGGYIDRVNPLNGDMVDRDSNWQNNSSVRAALTYAPVESVKITPSVFYQRTFVNNQPSIWAYSSDTSSNQFRTGSQVEQPTTDTMTLPALDISVDLGRAEFHSNTSYLDRTYKVLQNFSNFIPAVVGVDVYPGTFIPGLPGWTSQATDYNTQGSFTQEFRLQSNDPSQRLKWVAGLFYQRSAESASEVLPETPADYDAFAEALFGASGESVFGFPLANVSAFPFTPYTSQTDYSFVNMTRGVDKQIAGFADLTYKVTDRLALNAGVRVAHTTFDFWSFGDGPFAGGPSLTSGEQKDRPITPKFGVSFQADPDDLLYASASKGFREGGVNAPVSDLCNGQLASLGLNQAPPGFKSDSVWSYEIGSKNAFNNRRLEIETSAYIIDWTGIQQSIYLSSCGMTFTSNIGKARSKGFDLSMQAHPINNLTLTAAAGYTKAEYTQTVVGGPPSVNGAQTYIVNKGDSLGAYPWVIAAGIAYRFDVLGHRSNARLDYSYKSAAPDNTPQFDSTSVSFNPRAWQAPATRLVDGRAGMQFGGTEVSLFVRNLFNSHVDLSRVSLAPVHNYIDEFILLTPRTVGVTVDYRY